MDPNTPRHVTRRDVLHNRVAAAAAMAPAGSHPRLAQSDQAAVVAEIAKQHDAIVHKPCEWRCRFAPTE